ncbi:condensin-2 complex subunit d3 [Nannochloropsis oceanica]
MATLELEGATVEALEALGLGQLDTLETANTVIGGDLMDLLDTTELPPATAWRTFNEFLEEWKKVNDGGEFWSLVSKSWGGDTGTGHRALLALLHLAFRTKDKGEEPWLAAKTYVWLMDLPGASAYGVFNGAMFRSLLALVKSWVESAAAGGATVAGAGDTSSTSSSSSSQQHQQPTAAASTTGRSRRAAAARSRTVSQQQAEREEEVEDDDDDTEDEGRGGRRGKARTGKRTTSNKNSTAALINRGLESLLLALHGSLTTGSLAASLCAHDDVQGELTDLVLAVYSLAHPAAGSLAQATRGVLMALITVAGGPGGNPIVLRALMPLLTMKPSRNGLPTDAKTRTGAHQRAVQLLTVLIKEGEEQKKRGSDEVAVEEGEGGEERREDGEDGGDPMEVDVGDGAVEEEEQALVEEGKKEKGKQAGKKKGKKSKRGATEDDEGDEEDANNTAKSTHADETDPSQRREGSKAATAKQRMEVPKDLHMTVLAVLEHMCTEAPDRADVRSRLVDSVLTLLESLQQSAPELGPRFILFLAKLIRSVKVSHRAFGVEIAASFVNAPWAWPSENEIAFAEEEREEGKRKEEGKTARDVWTSLVALVESFASRVVDKAPTVRARAMVCLSEMLLSVQEEAAPPGLREAILGLAFPNSPHNTLGAAAAEADGAEGGNDAVVPTPQDLVGLVRSRCQDDKAVVRKAALQALEILLTTGASRGGGKVGMVDVELFAVRCNDVSVLTRKQAMASLSSLLLADPGNALLQSTWVKAVLPLVADPEQSILNRLVDLVHEVILDRIINWHRQRKEGAAGPASGKPQRSRRGAAHEEAMEEEVKSEESAARAHAALRARTSTVWELLSIVASRDLNKCLQNAIGLVVQAQNSQVSAPRRLKELMDALQTAALASIDSSSTTTTAAATGAVAVVEDPTALRRGAWALLEAILASDRAASALLPSGSSSSSSGGGKVMPSDPAFVITCWRRAFEGLGGEEEAEALEEDSRKILRVLARIAPDVPAEVGMGLAEELLGYLRGLHPGLSPENCGAALETISALSLAKAQTLEEGAVIIRKAAGEVLEACEKVLRRFVVGPEEGGKERGGEGGRKEEGRHISAEERRKLERATFLVGAVAILGFSPNEEESKSVAAVAAASAAEKGRKKKKAEAPAAGTPGGGPLIRVPVPAATVSLIRVLLLPEILPMEEAKKIHEEGGREGRISPEGTVAVPVPDSVRAHAFLALGKACLRDKGLAKENVNVFVRELSVGSSAAIKSNALLILGDLCVRYTSLVERHVPSMARCLQDESALIRRHALALISQLLLQDYLKWRGLLLHRYLAVLVDGDMRVAEVADYMIFNPLLRKCPSLFVNHFVETLVVLNGCVDHDAYKAALSQGAESGTAVTMEGVDLGGEGGTAKKRMHIYRAMLQHMSDEQRIQVTAKLTQDILGAATDEDGEAGGIKIQSYHRASRFAQGQRREAALKKLKRDENLVRDALAVLRCPDIKVAGGRWGGGGGGEGGGSTQDEDAEALMAEDGSGGGAEAAAAAKGRLLSKVSRKHLLEHVVPELVSLKACLERAHSPLIRNVMEYFLELMRHNKEEVKDALSANPTLFHEIEFDLQQFEKELKAQAEARAAMPPPSLSPKSPADALPRRSVGSSSSSSSYSGSNRVSSSRRQSSFGVGRTPLQARMSNSNSNSSTSNSGNSGRRTTPRLSDCSAPRLRRSSVGANLSRTPSEAIKAALQPGGSGIASQSFTPAVAKRGEGSVSGGGGEGGRVEREGERHVNVELPAAMKTWNVTVGRSPLDSKENRGEEEEEEGGEEQVDAGMVDV